MRTTTRLAVCTVMLVIAAGAALVATHPGRAGLAKAAAQAVPTKAGRSQYTCTKSITVLFIVYQGFSDPGSISPAPRTCWHYARLVQNTSTYMICHEDGSLNGNGATRVFDDTNPTNDFNTETNAIVFCANLSGGSGGIYAEYMAARTASWCSSNGYSSPCWRRNNGGNGAAGTIYHYLAELYSDDYHVRDLQGNWSATGYGASPSNSSPVINFLPDRGNTSALTSDVTAACSLVGNGGFLSLYAGSTTYGTIQSGDQSTINTALNSCTSTG